MTYISKSFQSDWGDFVEERHFTKTPTGGPAFFFFFFFGGGGCFDTTEDGGRFFFFFGGGGGGGDRMIENDCDWWFVLFCTESLHVTHKKHRLQCFQEALKSGQN